ncbi:MAG TPA: SusC/RagA family TonB-linked outer membrane protein [Chitinophaga sp.]|uniref:SusC/RagA family TonB-linked outer membrane protein n=1 Tax=Chitinophaga sp. TaxID=1869181 RepID=UPI002C95E1E7|nr:SusC/RagA family TonB-linked outer membrane protein [Chitinophaga sp.]HVI48454.1 SusC/RagA family TonB-linked outer membrane protein [Chitinophaga sp.]
MSKNYLLLVFLCHLVSEASADIPVNQPELLSMSCRQSQTTLKDVLKAVESRCRVHILYSEEVVTSKYSDYKLPAGEHMDVEQALTVILRPHGLQYQRYDSKTFSITKSSASGTQRKTPVDSLPAANAQRIIRGRIIAEDGNEPVPGASVCVKGNSQGTVADKDGNFRLSTPLGGVVLNVRHIGYNPQEITVKNNKDLVIRLVAKSSELKNVVITGIYKRPAESFTGSARTITADELKTVAPQNILQAISILDPAFQIPEDIYRGSDPNHLPNVQLRGQNNFPAQDTRNTSASLKSVYGDNPNAPLFILDGFQVSLERIFDLDMNRVDKISILKDAAATSLYGSRAANGVIVIDTRQPKEGHIRLSYIGGLQVSIPDLTSYQLMNTEQKLAYEKAVGLYTGYRMYGDRGESGKNSLKDQLKLDADYRKLQKEAAEGVNTYWLSQPLRTAIGSTHSLYLEGGDHVMRYGIDLGYQNIPGVMKGSARNKLNGGVTLTYRNEKLLFSNNLAINSTKGVNSPYGEFRDYTQLNPYWRPFDESGRPVRKYFYNDSSSSIANPLYNATLPTENYTTAFNVSENLRVEWTPLGWLRFTGQFTYNRMNTEDHNFKPADHTDFDGKPAEEKGSYTLGTGKSTGYTASIGFDIRKSFDKSLLYVIGNGYLEENRSNQVTATAVGFPNDRAASFIFGGQYQPDSRPSGTSGLERMASGRFNVSYIYDNRYLLDFSGSVDVSSQFGTNRSVAPFWSVGAGWNLHREKFLHTLKWIDYLKLRATIGTVGAQNFPPYMGMTIYQYNTTQTYAGMQGANLVGYGNADLGWQKTLKRNLGVDGTLFKNRLTFIAEYYYNTTKDLILPLPTPPSVGFSNYMENIGALRNTGWQVGINGVVLQDPRKGFYWRLGVSAFHNTNIITHVNESLKETGLYYGHLPKSDYEEGASLSALWLYNSLGIDPANGRELFRAKDGGQTYSWYHADKIIAGDTLPKLSGTISTGIDFRGFSVNLYLTYRIGAKLYNQTLAGLVENARADLNRDVRTTDAWLRPGDNSPYKHTISNGHDYSDTYPTTRFVQTEYLLEAASVSATYRLPDSWLKRFKMSNSRLDFYMANPFYISTITRERGVDYPFARSFTLKFGTTFF